MRELGSQEALSRGEGQGRRSHFQRRAGPAGSLGALLHPWGPFPALGFDH